jgi:hypothetical protein
MVGLGGFPPDAASKGGDVAPGLGAGCLTHRRHDCHVGEHVPVLPPGHPALAGVEAVGRAPGADQVTEQITELCGRPPCAAFPAEAMGRSALQAMVEPRAGVIAAFPFHVMPGVVLPGEERIACCRRAE